MTTKLNVSLNFGSTYELSDNVSFETFFGVGVSFISDVRNGYYRDINGDNQDVRVTFTPTRMHFQSGARITYSF